MKSTSSTRGAQIRNPKSEIRTRSWFRSASSALRISDFGFRASSSAFTLLEVMLAVMIMALIGIAIYRFVMADLDAIRISTTDTVQKNAVQALVAVISEEFCNLPQAQQNALTGEAHKFNDKASDQVEWLTQAGNGLFTEAAQGQWKVTLLLRSQEKSSSFTLGVLRQVSDTGTIVAGATGTAFSSSAANDKDNHWLPLLKDVDAIEIRYFDPRLNAWLDKWSDSQSVPSLVRLRIWRANQTIPYEAVIELPPTKLPS